MDSAQMRVEMETGSSARTVIAAHSLRELVQNSNLINEIQRKGVNLNYEPIKKGRVKLSGEIFKPAAEMIRKYGIKLMDVVFRQIRYPNSITEKAYRQMIKAD